MTTISKHNDLFHTSKYGGMMGLSMVVIQKLVELMGAGSGFESELGKGSTFVSRI